MSQFLSMKLEAVNSRIAPGIEVFPPKDVSIKQHPYIELHLMLNNLKAGFIPFILNFVFWWVVFITAPVILRGYLFG